MQASYLPRAVGPGRKDALAPVAAIHAPRRDPQATAGALNERVLSGEYIATKTASALPPLDFSRHLFDTLARTAANESEAANAGLAIKAVHAYLLAAMPAAGDTGLRIDGYA